MKKTGGKRISASVPAIQLTVKGIRLLRAKHPGKFFAGERLGTVIERAMDEKGLDAKDFVDDLPIRADALKRIQSGLNSRPPDDVLEAIAKALGLDADELKETADLDKSEPVENFFF